MTYHILCAILLTYTISAQTKQTEEVSMTEPKGFKVTVEGDYYSKYADNDGHVQKKVKKYRLVVLLPQIEAALSVIRNYLLEPALKKKYPNYTKYRTHVIKNIETLDGRPVQDVRYMNVSQLQDYIEINGLPIDVSVLTAVQELREAIRLYQDNPDQYAAWSQKVFKEKKITSLLSALNPDLFTDDLEESELENEEAKSEPAAKEKAEGFDI